MSSWNRQEQSNKNFYYSENQVRRTLLSSGIRLATEIDNDFIVFCPFHNNTRTPAGEVQKETGMFYCFACQETKTLIELVMKVTGGTYFESYRLIESNSETKNILQSVENLLEKKVEFEEYDPALMSKLHHSVFLNERAMEYFKSRGIYKSSVEKYRLGYSETQDMITIPVHSPEGVCIGFVARSIEGKTFKNSTGLHKSKTIFNLHRAKRYHRVFVVESSFDAIRIEQVGGHAVAILGATISKEQKRLLNQYFSQVIVVGDNDEAGKGMAEKVRSYVGGGCVIAELPENVKDVSDLSDEELKKFVSRFDEMLLGVLK